MLSVEKYLNDKELLSLMLRCGVTSWRESPSFEVNIAISEITKWRDLRQAPELMKRFVTLMNAFPLVHDVHVDFQVDDQDLLLVYQLPRITTLHVGGFKHLSVDFTSCPCNWQQLTITTPMLEYQAFAYLNFSSLTSPITWNSKSEEMILLLPDMYDCNASAVTQLASTKLQHLGTNPIDCQGQVFYMLAPQRLLTPDLIPYQDIGQHPFVQVVPTLFETFVDVDVLVMAEVISVTDEHPSAVLRPQCWIVVMQASETNELDEPNFYSPMTDFVKYLGASNTEQWSVASIL